MTPVISPWVFYLMPVCENFCGVAWIIFAVCCITLVVTSGVYLGCYDYCKDGSHTLFKRILKTAIVVLIVTALLGCLIPSEETLTKMIIAQNVTVERVDMVSDTVVTVYNDIMALFQDSGAANG